MNTLVAAFENKTSGQAFTKNGAVTLPTSGVKCVDLFAAIGSAQKMDDVLNMFEVAYREHKEIATRVALWGRDARGGAGRREAFRYILRWLEVNDFEMFTRVLAKTPELGRWDDVLCVQTDAGREIAFGMIARALAAGDRLAAKWMPRKATPKDDTAARLREFLGLTPRQYRKLLVRNTAVVETAMCSKNWAEITYEHVPSVAAARYARAFKKNDEARYGEFIESLKKDPSKKINTATLYPHDLYKTLWSGNQDDYAEQAWARLPDYIPEGLNYLPMIDTSSSMMTGSGATGMTCMDLSVSLGLYLMERQKGAFKNRGLTFNTRTEWIVNDPTKSLRQRFTSTRGANWGGSTSLQSAFDLLLDTAIKNNVRAEDMPTHIVILSDMEFNRATGNAYASSYYSRSENRTSENFSEIDRKYAKAGYTRPTIIFWNLNARVGNSPVTYDEYGTAMISGFSPAIMKTVMTQKVVTPLESLLETVGVERYNIFE
jgi:Mg-chelatase subunit ChlD